MNELFSAPKIYHRAVLLKTFLQALKSDRADLKIGFVPTMGALHQGHLSLLETALKNNDWVILSIYVNPLQFGPDDDFHRYPRDLKADHELILKTFGEKAPILIFNPLSMDDIFGENFSSNISVGALSRIKEGAVRPGHFDGVCTVVYKLFAILKPDRAYFGQKDYQQCLVIKKMIQDLELPVEFIMCPIWREENGLAMSSRNRYLTETERNEASIIYQTLNSIKKLLAEKKFSEEILEELKIKHPRFESLEVLDANTLDKPKDSSQDLLIIAVYKIRQTRLLDNMLVHLC